MKWHIYILARRIKRKEGGKEKNSTGAQPMCLRVHEPHHYGNHAWHVSNPSTR